MRFAELFNFCKKPNTPLPADMSTIYARVKTKVYQTCGSIYHRGKGKANNRQRSLLIPSIIDGVATLSDGTRYACLKSGWRRLPKEA